MGLAELEALSRQYEVRLDVLLLLAGIPKPANKHLFTRVSLAKALREVARTAKLTFPVHPYGPPRPW